MHKGQTATRQAFSYAHTSNALFSHSIASWDTKHSHTQHEQRFPRTRSPATSFRAAGTLVQAARLTFCGAFLPRGFPRVTSDLLISPPFSLALALSRVRSLSVRVRAVPLASLSSCPCLLVQGRNRGARISLSAYYAPTRSPAPLRCLS